MYAAERHRRIVEEARRTGRVAVAELAGSLGVTPETVRRDLTSLEEHGTLRRVHGGAIPVERLEPTLATRTTRSTDEKRRIAARALDEIPADGAVLLDSGSTTLAIAALIPVETHLTVVTNSVQAAALLTDHPNLDLLLLGGRVRGVTGAAVGTWTTSLLAGLSVDVAFVGTNGLSSRRGLSTPDEAEAAAKSAMLEAAARTVVVTDSSKFGVDHLHSFAPLSAIDLVITDDAAERDLLAETGVEVVYA